METAAAGGGCFEMRIPLLLVQKHQGRFSAFESGGVAKVPGSFFGVSGVADGDDEICLRGL